MRTITSVFTSHDESPFHSESPSGSSGSGSANVNKRSQDPFTPHLRDICFTLGNRHSRVTAGTTV